MPNQFIDLYQGRCEVDNKLVAARSALAAISQDRKNWSYGIRFNFSDFPKIFYNPSVTKRHQLILETILQELEQLPDISDLGLYELLSKHVSSFSDGDTKDLINYIKDDVYRVYYNPRTVTFLNQPAQQNNPIQVNDILKKKGLSPNIFDNVELNLASDMSHHVRWLFDNIYSKKYPDVETIDGIARYIHGIQHVTRASMYSKVWINLYKKYGDADALKLTEEDSKLIELALLFHDSAREDENEDHWDNESATLLFKYLIDVLKVPLAKAVLIAESTANKDVYPDKYYALKFNNGEISWEVVPARPKKNIYQKIIHDSDCLDIIRARPAFDGSYLDFDKQFSANNPAALNDMARFKNEAYNIICAQGDEYEHTNSDLKRQYEHREVYTEMYASIKPQKNPLIHALTDTSLSRTQLETAIPQRPTFNAEKGLCAENLNALMDEGKVLVRTIHQSAKTTKKHPGETQAELELRKVRRRKGVATQSKKANRVEKAGNPERSGSLLGFGTHLFSNAGFGISSLDIDMIQTISVVDSNTGYGKKKNAIYKKKFLSREEKEKQLQELLQKMKRGGSTFDADNYHASHVELTCDIFEYDCIFFSKQHNLANFMGDSATKGNPFHQNAPLLEAVYLQGLYASKYNKELPIFEYDANAHTISSQPPLAREHLLKLWVEMCQDYLLKLSEKPNDVSIFTLTADEIKIKAMYSSDAKITEYQSPDIFYDDESKEMLNAAIMEFKAKVINEKFNRLCSHVRSEQANFLELSLARELIAFPNYPKDVENLILTKLEQLFSSQTDFNLSHFSKPSFTTDTYTGYVTSSKTNAYFIERLFSDNAHLRLYHLAKRFSPDNAEQIRQNVLDFILSYAQQKKDTISVDNLTDLMIIAKAYEIDATLRPTFNNLLFGALEHVIASSGKFSMARDLVEVLSLTKSFGAINQESKDLVRDAILYLIKKNMVSFMLYDLYNTCELNEPNTLNMLHNAVMDKLSNTGEYNYSYGSELVVLLTKSGLLNIPAIFQPAIEKITGDKWSTHNYFSLILTVIDKYKSAMPDNKFLSWQLSIINKKMDDALDNYLHRLKEEESKYALKPSRVLNSLQESINRLNQEEGAYKPQIDKLFKHYHSYLVDDKSTFTPGEFRQINDFIATIDDPVLQQTLREGLDKKMAILAPSNSLER